jgi:hypothetical protein
MGRAMGRAMGQQCSGFTSVRTITTTSPIIRAQGQVSLGASWEASLLRYRVAAALSNCGVYLRLNDRSVARPKDLPIFSEVENESAASADKYRSDS